MIPFADSTFYFRQPWPVGVLMLLVVAAVGAAAFFYLPLRSLPRWKRVLLGGFRVLLLVLLLLFEPVGARTREVRVLSNVLVLIDVSESTSFADDRKSQADLEDAALALGKMKFSDGTLPGGVRAEVSSVSRLDLARGILNHPELAFFREQPEKYRLRYFAFGGRLQPAPDDPAEFREWLARQKADAASTRLGDALQQAVERFSGQPIAAVIVLTDGASNEGADPLSVARSLGVPVLPVGLGLPQPDDVRLMTVNVPEAVFPKDRVPVRVQLQSSTAFVGREVNVTLRADGKELARQAVTLTGTPQFAELSFVPEQKTGTLSLEIAVSPLPGEATEENNSATRTVKMIDEKIKVLFVEGRPRWEFRYLRAVLERDHRMTVKFLLTEGDKDLAKASPEKYLASLPEDEKAALDHDHVILGDVPADVFTAKQLSWLEKLVREKGGSFLMLGGSRHAPAKYADTPVAKLLPVKLSAGGRQLVASDVYTVVTTAGDESRILTLEDARADNRAAWSVVKPLIDVPRLGGAKPGATVLATLSDRADRSEPYPLIAWQRYGTGKAMFVGTDKLWRLRFKRGDEYHARFWAQAIQFLTLSRLLGENKRVRFETDRSTARTGERVLIQANVFDAEYRPVKAEAYGVLIESAPPKGEPKGLTLRAAPGKEGLFQGHFTAETAGSFVVKPLPRDEGLSNRAAFTVESVRRERLEPGMQKEALVKLAELSGGKYHAVRDLPSMPERFRDQSRKVTLPPQERELWDNWVVLAAVLALAGAEWFVRRQSDVASADSQRGAIGGETASE
jgi:hypothetical protein